MTDSFPENPPETNIEFILCSTQFFLRRMLCQNIDTALEHKMHRFVSSIFLCFTAVLLSMNSLAVAEVVTCSGIVPTRYRSDNISITDFGGVGDGLTLNTKAFRRAIYRIGHLKRRGGTMLYIPPGVYLTGSFNLTSHMTLYLARGAVIKATQVL